MSNCNTPSCNCNSTNNVCGCKTSSDSVAYTGPTLPCTGIENCTRLTEAIATISEYLCSAELVQTIINIIINNETLYSQFTTIVNNTVDCETVWNCATTTTTTTLIPITTTTTSTIVPTTTTTTTACDCYFYSIRVANVDIIAADGGIVYASYTNCFGDFVTKEYTEVGLYENDFCASLNPKEPVLYYYIETIETVAENEPIQEAFCCDIETTTTTTTVIECFSIDVDITAEFIIDANDNEVFVVYPSCPDGKSEEMMFTEAGKHFDVFCSINLEEIEGYYYVGEEEISFNPLATISENPCLTTTTTTII